MDPITARQVLRIFPDAPLTVELVERAYSEEYWARHPSRYQDSAERREAEQWAGTLATARQVLLHEAGTATTTDAATAAPRKRGLSGGAIAGIVAGGVALLALVTFGAIGAVNLVTQAATTAQEAIEEELDQAGGTVEDGVVRYEASETGFAFPSAIEWYLDGRYDDQCSLEHEQGCWEAALFTEEDCTRLQVQYGFSNDAEASVVDVNDAIEVDDVVAGEAVPVVFGNDEYAYGWITRVTCLRFP